MRGEFAAVWPETWNAIWLPLAESKAAPLDLFCELYRELGNAFAEPPSIEVLADVIDDPEKGRKAFEASRTVEFASEKALVSFLEVAHGVLDDLQGDELANCYFVLRV